MSLSILLIFEVAVKTFKLSPLQFLGHIGIDVQRSRNVFMPKRILYHFYIDARFAHPGGKGVSERMATKMRKQYLCVLVLQQLFIITVTYNATYCFIECRLILSLPKTIDEYEIAVPVYCCLALIVQWRYVTSLSKSSDLPFQIDCPPSFQGEKNRRVHLLRCIDPERALSAFHACAHSD